MMSDVESVWAVMSSWLTPSILFLFLNLTIGTIAVISAFATQKKQPHHHHQQFEGADGPPMVLARAPSLLDRVRSFDFSLYASPQQQHPPDEPPNPSSPPEPVQFQPENPSDLNGSTRLARAPSLLDRLKSFNFSFDKYQHSQPDPDPSSHQESVAARSDIPDEGEMFTTETESDARAAPPVREKMKKSASSRWSFRGRNMEEEEEIDRRRPATVRDKGSKASAAREAAGFGGGDDEGVDAKADDFINRFKQQLKLQRLDSLLRFRETMLNNRGPAT